MSIDAVKLLPASMPETVAVLTAQSDPGDSIEPISLQEAKDHLRVVFNDEDDYISALIVAARQMAEGKLNRTLVQRTLRAAFDTMDAGYRLPKPPIVSVDAVSLLGTDGVETPVEADQYALGMLGDRLAANVGALWPGAVRGGSVLVVEYTAGYAPGEVPAPIIQWMKIQIGTMYEQREAVAAGVQLYAMPNDFIDLLIRPYMVYE